MSTVGHSFCSTIHRTLRRAERSAFIPSRVTVDPPPDAVPRESNDVEYRPPEVCMIRSRTSGIGPVDETFTRDAAIVKISLGMLDPTDTLRGDMPRSLVISLRTSCFVSPRDVVCDRTEAGAGGRRVVSFLQIEHHSEYIPWRHSSMLFPYCSRVRKGVRC